MVIEIKNTTTCNVIDSTKVNSHSLFVFQISRESIDAVKDYFRDEMTKPDWALMVELKKLFQIL